MSTNNLVYFDPFSIEDVQQYIMEESLRSGVLFSPKKVKRVHYHGDRYYCFEVEQQEGEAKKVSAFYPSVTTITKHGKSADINLFKWYADQGWQEVQKILWHKRRFGTFSHIVLAELSAKMMEKGDRYIDLAVGDLFHTLGQYAHYSGLPVSWVYEYWPKLCKALTSWRLFCIHYEVEFLLIEKTLINASRGYAGTMDYLLRYVDGPRYARACKSGPKYGLKSRKEVEQYTGALDYKSGYNGPYEDGVLQLHLLGMAVEENFGIKPDTLLHFNPTDWRSAPAFNLVDVSNHQEAANLEPVLEIALNRLEAIDDKPYKKAISGWLMADDGFKFDTITVREAMEWHLDGRDLELGLAGPDQELHAENYAMEQLRKTFVVKAEPTY